MNRADARRKSDWRPSTLKLTQLRFAIELRSFWRTRDEVIFTFLFPVILLSLFSVIFGGQLGDTGVDVNQYYVAGMLASTGITVGFQSLSGQIALEQFDGTLKRLAGTPMPKAAYMAGKIAMVTTIATIQTATMFLLGVVAFDLSLPTGRNWPLLASVLGLNLAIWTLLGLAFSRIISDPRSGGAVALPPTLVLQFISGVYVPFDNIPPWLRSVASVFPLRWAALGLRQAVLPDNFQVAEPSGSWQTSTMYLMLGLWLAVSAVAATLLFRWRTQE